MTVPSEDVVSPPEAIAKRYADWEWEVVSAYPPNALTYRLRSPSGVDRFLKLARPGLHPSLAAEAERTRWAGAHLPVPTVLAVGAESDATWLVTEELAGRDATDAAWSADPERVVRALAAGLRRFHRAPVADCPFHFGVDSALRHARHRVEHGRVDAARDFHAEFAGLSAHAAMSVLEETHPEEEDLVVCHGDYCPPNVLIDDWGAVGFVDLGELGVADLWWDLAVATWSVGWNYGEAYERVFLDGYGVDRDEERIAFYRLLYDMVS